MVHARTARFARRVDEAKSVVESFAKEPCYAGSSWGKDSVVIAHLIATCAPHVPIVWIKVIPRENPDCSLVRDRFLAMHSVTYEEIVTQAWFDGRSWLFARDAGEGAQMLGFGDDFAPARERYGSRYISGVRGTESHTRRIRVAKHGLQSKNACAPLGHWGADDVFAYLISHGLPIHPAYGYLMGGTLDPGRVRVSFLDGGRGSGFGRAEWEKRYYGEAVARARKEGLERYERR